MEEIPRTQKSKSWLVCSSYDGTALVNKAVNFCEPSFIYFSKGITFYLLPRLNWKTKQGHLCESGLYVVKYYTNANKYKVVILKKLLMPISLILQGMRLREVVSCPVLGLMTLPEADSPRTSSKLYFLEACALFIVSYLDQCERRYFYEGCGIK